MESDNHFSPQTPSITYFSTKSYPDEEKEEEEEEDKEEEKEEMIRRSIVIVPNCVKRCSTVLSLGICSVHVLKVRQRLLTDTVS